MLSTTYPQFGAILLSILAVALATRAYYLIRTVYSNVDTCIHWVKTENKASVSLRRMAEVEATLTDLLDSYQNLLESHKKLRSRIGMRELRDKKAEAATETPDLLDEGSKSAYKSELRKQLRASGRLR